MTARKNISCFRKIFLFTILASLMAVSSSAQIYTLASQTQILSAGNTNNFAAGDVLLSPNAVTINGTSYDMLITILGKNLSGTGRVNIAEPNTGSFHLHLGGVNAELDPVVVYNMKLVESGSATPGNLTGNPVSLLNLSFGIADIDGSASIFPPADDRKAVEIAGYRLTDPTVPPTVTVNGSSLTQQDFYNFPASRYPAYTKYRPNVSTPNLSDNALANNTIWNSSGYILKFQFDEFPATGIDILYGVTADISQSPVSGTLSRSIFHVFRIEASTVLPVALSHFEGTLNGSVATINWKSEWEESLSHYELERSSNGGIDFQTIAVVFATNERQGSAYSYADKNVVAGKRYSYRLRMVDKDGTAKYSSVITLAAGGNTSSSLKAYPNPARSIINLELPVKGGQITIYNTEGRMLHQQNTAASTETIDISRLPAGMYHIQFASNDRKISQSVKIRKD